MSAHLIELSDAGIRISNQQEQLAVSPGYAWVSESGPVFGDIAQANARLHPRDSFNHFWYQPSLEPLSHDNSHFRHKADMAFAHLSSLTQTHSRDKDVIFAIPAHYSRDHLSILLGLCQHCPITPIGLVDGALLSSAEYHRGELSIYVDLQLHQAVLSHIRLQNGELIREKIQQIPGAGLLSLQDAWANLITDTFIKQCRFNPLHAATTEQFIYQHMHSWMTKAGLENEVLMEINHKETLYQATIHLSAFTEKTKGVLATLNKEMQASLGNNYQDSPGQLIAPDAHIQLPGFSEFFPNIIFSKSDSIQRTTAHYEDHINEQSQGQIFLTRLPALNTENHVSRPEKKNKPLQLLIGHRSFSLPQSGTIEINNALVGQDALPHAFTLLNGVPENAGENQHTGMHISLCPQTLLVNDRPAQHGQPLHPGDRLQFDQHALVMHVIEVG